MATCDQIRLPSEEECAKQLEGEGLVVADLVYDGLHVLIPPGTGGNTGRTEEGRRLVLEAVAKVSKRVANSYGFRSASVNSGSPAVNRASIRCSAGGRSRDRL